MRGPAEEGTMRESARRMCDVFLKALWTRKVQRWVMITTRRKRRSEINSRADTMTVEIW